MSRGLGRTQRAILEVLEDRGGWESLQALAAKVYHPERWEWKGKIYFAEDPSGGGYQTTRSEYTATHRAVKALEKRGLVETRDANYKAWAEGQGGQTRGKEVRLSVDSTAK